MVGLGGKADRWLVGGEEELVGGAQGGVGLGGASPSPTRTNTGMPHM